MPDYPGNAAIRAQLTPKDPKSKAKYSFDWSRWLSSGSLIAVSSWTITPASLAIVAATFTGSITTIVVASGVEGSDYALVNTITTSADTQLIEPRTGVIPCRSR